MSAKGFWAKTRKWTRTISLAPLTQQMTIQTKISNQCQRAWPSQLLSPKSPRTNLWPQTNTATGPLLKRAARVTVNLTLRLEQLKMRVRSLIQIRHSQCPWAKSQGFQALEKRIRSKTDTKWTRLSPREELLAAFLNLRAMSMRRLWKPSWSRTWLWITTSVFLPQGEESLEGEASRRAASTQTTITMSLQPSLRSQLQSLSQSTKWHSWSNWPISTRSTRKTEESTSRTKTIVTQTMISQPRARRPNEFLHSFEYEYEIELL